MIFLLFSLFEGQNLCFLFLFGRICVFGMGPMFPSCFITYFNFQNSNVEVLRFISPLVYSPWLNLDMHIQVTFWFYFNCNSSYYRNNLNVVKPGQNLPSSRVTLKKVGPHQVRLKLNVYFIFWIFGLIILLYGFILLIY